MFVDFDNYLKKSFSLDFWEDEGISIAEEILNSFSEDDWNSLINILSSREKAWRIRCANVLSEIEDENVIDILISIAITESLEVKLAALDSINSKLSLQSMSNNSISNLERLINTTPREGQLIKIILNSLASKISQLK